MPCKTIYRTITLAYILARDEQKYTLTRSALDASMVAQSESSHLHSGLLVDGIVNDTLPHTTTEDRTSEAA